MSHRGTELLFLMAKYKAADGQTDSYPTALPRRTQIPSAFSSANNTFEILETMSSAICAQRSRLLRSRRKVEALLGESLSLPAEAVYAPTTTPCLAVAEYPKNAHHPSRPVLLVHVPTIPTSSSSSSSSSLGSLSPLSPLSPTFTPVPANSTRTLVDDPARHAAMAAKLARTLGENIPPYLVKASTAAERRRRRASSAAAFLATSVRARSDTLRSIRREANEARGAGTESVVSSSEGSVGCTSDGSETYLLSRP